MAGYPYGTAALVAHTRTSSYLVRSSCSLLFIIFFVRVIEDYSSKNTASNTGSGSFFVKYLSSLFFCLFIFKILIERIT